ncbi:MAG TPA: aminotransferase class I/II-fold pyridoxal phosphate-dependent enzyme [Acidimicrobiia bacterium]|nr:aminotransferase class I/II-fold pyridoxal phosphate-dependent enzyme [Acidimicrobiia bacterium]
MRINPSLTALGEYSIGRLQEMARQMRADGRPMFDFSIGDPREPTARFIIEAAKEAIPAVSQYPTTSGLPELRDAIAGYVVRRFGVEIDPSTQVMPTSGGKESIFSSHLAFVDRNRSDVVAWPTPGYPIYQRGAVLSGATPYPVKVSGDFVLRASDIPDPIWQQAAMLWICTPHNPAGSVTSAADLGVLYERARQYDTLLCSDECYADLYDEAPPSSILQIAGPGSAGCLSFLSLSKRSGMTGYRSGAIVGDPEAIKAIKSLRTATGTASPEFIQSAAIAAWADDDHVAERRDIFRQKRAILAKAFDSLGYQISGSVAGIHLWVEVDDDVVVSERLLNDGILVTPGRGFGPGGVGYIRLALVPTLDQCEEAAEALAACLGR